MHTSSTPTLHLTDIKILHQVSYKRLKEKKKGIKISKNKCFRSSKEKKQTQHDTLSPNCLRFLFCTLEVFYHIEESSENLKNRRTTI